MVEIALAVRHALERRQAHGEPRGMHPRVLAGGDGWTVADVVCTSGPQDRPFEEQHSHHAIAIVLAGTFQYRSPAGAAMMTPGSVLLGNRGQCFECSHEHAAGDRCLSFWYTPEFFERLRCDAGHRSSSDFPVSRIPPLRALAPVVAAARTGILSSNDVSWEELGIKLASSAMALADGVRRTGRAPAHAEARVTDIVRAIDRQPAAPLTLAALAAQARLSRYHFLRTFERLTGVTPHQYIVRSRLREAASRLSTGRGRILDVALDCGFGDVSNFNRAFRAEFGVRPSVYQRKGRSRPSVPVPN